ncbi:MFS transporter [Phytoactinopolyspora halotolerans]|uniref:MFS transporter n=1 Tax=Phytoactinopolyspora halotolerans TaxID=1981512 RepID=A0A6L9S517_9ACTN|nr:MFS transporter [Phytoactinopolyspora halotolerans]NEE00073.1 MFS transporter [Phytoactinopolyspora halotolerans]
MTGEPAQTDAEPIEFGSRRGKLIITATVLASGVAFLDGTVVTVALPRIGTDLGAELSALQWVLNAYLLALGALVLVGGALGDLLGRRRVFLAGMWGFAAASLLCAVAWSPEALIGARALQGIFAAMLTPASLAILSSTFAAEHRGRAIGAWSGLSGVTTAIGPFVGGWLVDAASWRWIFLLNLPLLIAAVAVTRAAVPADVGAGDGLGRREILTRVDFPGAALTAAGLGLVVAALIEVERLPSWAVAVSVLIGLATLGGFVGYERRRALPMMPPELFRIRTFTVANLFTVVVYAALTGMGFLISLALQRGLGYSALQAGASTIPLTLMLLAFSARVGALLPRVGARPLLSAGGVLTAAGLLLLSTIGLDTTYLTGVFPGVMVFAVGLVLLVAPVTTTALTDVPGSRQGVASGVNNAVARIAGLLAVAVLPAAAGLSSTGATDPGPLLDGVSTALRIAAVSCVIGAAIAWVGLRPRDCRRTRVSV